MGLGCGLLGPWLCQAVSGRRGLGCWVTTLGLGLMGKLGLVAWLQGRMSSFGQGLWCRLGLRSGKSLLGVLRLLGGELSHSLRLNIRLGLARGCWVSRGWRRRRRRFIQC